jgi:hypothetical protein
MSTWTLAALRERRDEILGIAAGHAPSVPRTGREGRGGPVSGRRERLLDSTISYTRDAIADLHDAIERCHPREREWARRRDTAG